MKLQVRVGDAAAVCSAKNQEHGKYKKPDSFRAAGEGPSSGAGFCHRSREQFTLLLLHRAFILPCAGFLLAPLPLLCCCRTTDTTLYVNSERESCFSSSLGRHPCEEARVCAALHEN